MAIIELKKMIEGKWNEQRSGTERVNKGLEILEKKIEEIGKEQRERKEM